MIWYKFYGLIDIWSLIFILCLNLVSYILKVSIFYLAFILDFNLVISDSFVTCGRQFAYMDRHMSKWNSGNIKTDGKGPTYANDGNIKDQIETFNT
jgi:hypothetical protein